MEVDLYDWRPWNLESIRYCAMNHMDADGKKSVPDRVGLQALD